MGILRDKIEGPLANEGTELHRYFCMYKRALMSVRSNGKTFSKEPGGEWRMRFSRKPECTLEDWTEHKRTTIAKLQPWHFVADLPSIADLDRWIIDGVAESLSGDTVEPDGIGPDGAPSWLLALGIL